MSCLGGFRKKLLSTSHKGIMLLFSNRCFQFKGDCLLDVVCEAKAQRKNSNNPTGLHKQLLTNFNGCSVKETTPHDLLCRNQTLSVICLGLHGVTLPLKPDAYSKNPDLDVTAPTGSPQRGFVQTPSLNA